MLVPVIGKAYITNELEGRYREYERHVSHEIYGDNEWQQTGEKKKEQQAVKEMDDRIIPGEMIGKIKISKLDIDLILSEGVGKEALKSGAGHMEGTALPGHVGNCVIAGHRNDIFGSMFNRLDEIELGDLVYMEFKGKGYSYKINEVMIVQPDDLSVVEQQTESKSITLITCHPLYSSKYRLIVKGKLEEDN